jgi:endoglucanase
MPLVFRCWLFMVALAAYAAPVVHIRLNQVGYLTDEAKVALVFSDQDCRSMKFELVDAQTGKKVWGPARFGRSLGAYGRFGYHHPLDFTSCTVAGRYKIRLLNGNTLSLPFDIGPDVYSDYAEVILKYIRQQRCGYNPFLDQACHKKDGRTMYGPMPDSTYIDVSGGWHDAGDHLRYLMTSGNTVCRLLFSYRENRNKFVDRYDYWGHAGANGIADVLDEAKWGLDWMLKMHPEPDQLFHQVADDRDHMYFELPYADSSNYGWGKGQYRVVYYANGKPQGLFKYQNTSTGIANLAGRYAAAMAMAADIWTGDLKNPGYAAICLQAGREVYDMGKKQPGCQEGTPCRAPYRYHEITWLDDMEWGAAELFKVTREEHYLADAKRFARLAASQSWFGADSARHYEYYPFMNLGHYALFPVVDKPFQDTLANFYRTELERVVKKAQKCPYSIGHPFIWCSNNLAAALVMEGLLYQRMTGDTQFQPLVAATRDWLLGRNPWGASQFVAIPRSGGVTPHYPHSLLARLTGRSIDGGLDDGPVFASIFGSLKGVSLERPDPFAPFQSNVVVFHDDFWDYSTNEPTLDGTAEALYWFSAYVR